MEHNEMVPADEEGLPYRPAATIDQSELRNGLESLALFDSDPNMCGQAFNLTIVDQALTQLETQLLRKQVDGKPYLQEAAFLNALSQMWIFAAYELVRTWRQRASDILKWAGAGGLQTKLKELRRPMGFTHFGREIRAEQIEIVIADQALINRIRTDLRKTHIPFTRMEAIRISMAKHEVRKRPNSVALLPNYGRINRWCGSLDYDLSHEATSMGTISRRDIADDLRAIPQLEAPTDEEIKDFDAYMRGPSAEELASLFSDPPKEV